MSLLCRLTRVRNRWKKGKKRKPKNSDGTNVHSRCSLHLVDVYSATTPSHSDKWHRRPRRTVGNRRPQNFTRFSCLRKWRRSTSRKMRHTVTLWYLVELNSICLPNDVGQQPLPIHWEQCQSLLNEAQCTFLCSSSFVIDRIKSNIVLAVNIRFAGKRREVNVGLWLLLCYAWKYSVEIVPQLINLVVRDFCVLSDMLTVHSFDAGLSNMLHDGTFTRDLEF